MTDVYDQFEDSPIALSTEQIQRSKAQADTFYNIFLIVLLLILVFVILYYFMKNMKRQSSSPVEIGYNRVFGDAYDDNVEEVLRVAEEKKDLRPIDNYRVGVIQIQNVGDVDAGNNFFHRAIQGVIERPNDEDAVFILGGIEDFKRADNAELFQLLDQAREMVFDNHINTIHERKINEMPKAGDPQYVQKAVLSKQKWYSDSQNVHDAKMTDVMLMQYKQVKEENKQKGLTMSYETAKKFILNNIPPKEQHKKEYIQKTLDTMERNVSSLDYVNEIDVLETVVARAMDPANEQNRLKIIQALANSLADGSNDYATVCLTGRSKLIWQSLALLDFNPEIGIMKSTQMIRNEILEKVAKIISEEEGKESPETIKEYVSGGDNQQISEMKNRILERIELIRDVYKDIADPKDLNLIICECKAEIS